MKYSNKWKMKRLLFIFIIGTSLLLENPSWHIMITAWGNEITFVCYRIDAEGHNREVCTINPDGTNQSFLTNTPEISEVWPTFSPDKTKIAFGGLFPNNLYLMDAIGDNVTVVKKDYPSTKRHTWSPDGWIIAYGGDFHIQFLDTQTGTETAVWIPIEFDIRDVAWSPDGRQLAFATRRNHEARDIYVVNVDGTDLRRLTHNRSEDRYPAWSPDGRKIAFVSHRNVVDGGIFLMNADGENVTELTRAGESHPSWSPDGTKIVCTVRLGNLGHIGVMDADGQNLTVLAEGNSPSWQSTFPGLAVRPFEMLTLTWGQIKSDGVLK